MATILQRLAAGDVLVADGAMGTLLMEHGLEPGDCPERFNLERPEILRMIAEIYLRAGADIVQTNTFGGSPLKLAHYGLEERTEEINAMAVHAARDAVGDGSAFVSGSCGPCGKLLVPYGDADPGQLRESFGRQAAALVEAGVDMLCIETMTDLAEATLAIEAARTASWSIPIAATMTFEPSPTGFFTVMGTSIERAVRGLTDAGADIIGSNCGNGIAEMVKIAGEMRQHTTMPMIIQANAGMPELVDGKVAYPESPLDMTEGLCHLVDFGVGIIGGCCGTTPEHIRAIRGCVDAHG